MIPSFQDLNDWCTRAFPSTSFIKLQRYLSILRDSLYAASGLASDFAREYSTVQMLQYNAQGNVQDVTPTDSITVPKASISAAIQRLKGVKSELDVFADVYTTMFETVVPGPISYDTVEIPTAYGTFVVNGDGSVNLPSIPQVPYTLAKGDAVTISTNHTVMEKLIPVWRARIGDEDYTFCLHCSSSASSVNEGFSSYSLDFCRVKGSGLEYDSVWYVRKGDGSWATSPSGRFDPTVMISVSLTSVITCMDTGYLSQPGQILGVPYKATASYYTVPLVFLTLSGDQAIESYFKIGGMPQFVARTAQQGHGQGQLTQLAESELIDELMQILQALE